MELEGKTIILTGATRIGQTVAEQLTKKGANLVVTYLSSPSVAEGICDQAQKNGVKAIAVKTDVSQEADIKNLITKVKAQLGQIDGLVHMAANYPRTPWAQLTEADYDKTMAIIAKSTFLLGKLIGDQLLQNSGEIKGKIITISDWSIFRSPYKDYLPYNMAKAAVEGATVSLAKELAPGIAVNCIAPGPILKPADLTEKENQAVMKKTPLNRWGGAEVIAQAVIFLLENDFITGQIINIDGGRSIT